MCCEACDCLWAFGSIWRMEEEAVGRRNAYGAVGERGSAGAEERLAEGA